MNLNEWEKEIKNMDEKKREDVIAALRTLKQWEAFEREFEDVALWNLLAMAEVMQMVDSVTETI